MSKIGNGRNNEYWIETGLDMSATNSTDAIVCADYLHAALQIVWSGVTDAATVKPQVSTDGINWDDLDDNGVSLDHTTVGAAGSHTFALSTNPGRYVRLTVSEVDPTGSIDLHVVLRR